MDQSSRTFSFHILSFFFKKDNDTSLTEWSRSADRIFVITTLKLGIEPIKFYFISKLA